MEPSVMRRVFDPFFTTKSTGTGLGLSICHELIRAHGGEIQLRSSMGHGTSVRLLLPMVEPSPRTSAA
jgi:signal transduction histidine kinase